MDSHLQKPDLGRAADNPVYENMLTRRDTKAFNGKPVSKEIIDELLYAACWAPTHKVLEPWRFAVVLTAAKEKFLTELRQSILETHGREKGEAKAEDALPKLRRAGAFIAVACCPHEEPALTRDNMMATGCAVQNLLLLAHSLGVHCHWGSSAHLLSPRMRRFYGFDDNAELVGVIWLGYTDGQKVSKRSPVDACTNWITP